MSAIRKAGVLPALLLALLPVPLVAQDQDLVLTTVNPCVIFDTRQPFSSAGPFALDEQRSYNIAGSAADFTTQGGTAGGCGVPGWSGGQPVAKAVFINYVAIEPQGGGSIKAWATDKPEPDQGALVNFQALTPSMNNSNAVVTELRQDSQGLDINVRARGAGVHVRGVILGYFTRDHVSGVVAGTGLTGGGDSGTVTVGIADGGVGTPQMNAIGSVAGQVLTSTGGSVEWQNHPPGPTGPTGATGATGAAGPSGSIDRPVFERSTVNVSSYSISLAIGADGLGLISFPASGLSVAHCSNVACTSWEVSTFLTGSVGFTSIAIGADGLGLIAYYASGVNDLRVAHCTNVPCTSVTLASIDAPGSVGSFNTLTIGSDGLGLISYYDDTNTQLKVAHCLNVACSSSETFVVDTAGTPHLSTITTGSDGLGVIAYGSFTGLAVAHCTNLACSASTITDVGTLDGQGLSIVAGSDGLPLISFHSGFGGSFGLWVAHCSNVACTAATVSAIDPASEYVSMHTSITIGSDGLGLISYYHPAADAIKVAHCSNLTCTTGTTAIIDPVASSGATSSIAIGADRLGLIAYHDNATNVLKVAHLSNVFGIPFHRRR